MPTPPSPEFSRETLEFLDQLVDGVTLAANHPKFEWMASVIADTKRELEAALIAAGGVPISARRAGQE